MDSAESSSSPGLVTDDLPDPTYEELLGRVYLLVQSKNPALAQRVTKKLKPPQVMRVGTTRSCWTNFDDIRESLNREREHMKEFFLSELGTTGSLDAKNQFMVRGKFPPKTIESLLVKYITDYVMCANCRSLETELTRDAITRLYFMSCNACGSSRSVAQIRTGFHNVGRGERRRARATA